MFLISGFEIILGLTLFVIVGSVVAVILAMSMIRRNNKRYEEAPEKNARGEVVKLILRQKYTDITGLNTDPELEEWHFRKGNYLVQVLRDDGMFMLLSCNDKPYKKLVVGYYGEFTYKANILLDFRRNKSRELERQRMRADDPYFFKNRETSGITLGFFCEAPSFQIKIDADNPIQCDMSEAKEYAKHMLENTGENNFGLMNNGLTIQFFNNGRDEKIWIDLIDPAVSGVYQGEVELFNDLYGLIDAFFEGKDIGTLITLEYMELSK